MITISEALRSVLEQAASRSSEVERLESALGRVLAEDVICTLDSPPHDKSQVDGYAIRSSDLSEASIEFHVLEEVTAGRVPSLVVTERAATRIMTGAPIPEGADAVVMVERCELLSDRGAYESVRIAPGKVQPGQNIMRRGESMRRGDTILRAGHRLRAIEVGLLAELGVPHMKVYSKPRVAVLATGNELVPIHEQPGPGYIRNSNGPMLEALAHESDATPVNLGMARDTISELESKIREGLEQDFLLLSGGVSAGVLDLVPSVLGKLGVHQIFHKVDLKPGKPLWFGILPRKEQPPVLVFGLPGNPVSTFVGFHLFVRPALACASGETMGQLNELTGILTKDHPHRSDRYTFHPGRAQMGDGDLRIEPLIWRGSADLCTLAQANVLIHFPAGKEVYKAGTPVRVRMIAE